MTSSELMDKSQEETFQVLPSYKKICIKYSFPARKDDLKE